MSRSLSRPGSFDPRPAVRTEMTLEQIRDQCREERRRMLVTVENTDQEFDIGCNGADVIDVEPIAVVPLPPRTPQQELLDTIEAGYRRMLDGE